MKLSTVTKKDPVMRVTARESTNLSAQQSLILNEMETILLAVFGNHSLLEVSASQDKSLVTKAAHGDSTTSIEQSTQAACMRLSIPLSKSLTHIVSPIVNNQEMWLQFAG